MDAMNKTLSANAPTVHAVKRHRQGSGGEVLKLKHSLGNMQRKGQGNAGGRGGFAHCGDPAADAAFHRGLKGGIQGSIAIKGTGDGQRQCVHGVNGHPHQPGDAVQRPQIHSHSVELGVSRHDEGVLDHQGIQGGQKGVGRAGKHIVHAGDLGEHIGITHHNGQAKGHPQAFAAQGDHGEPGIQMGKGIVAIRGCTEKFRTCDGTRKEGVRKQHHGNQGSLGAQGLKGVLQGVGHQIPQRHILRGGPGHKVRVQGVQRRGEHLGVGIHAVHSLDDPLQAVHKGLHSGIHGAAVHWNQGIDLQKRSRTGKIHPGHSHPAKPGAGLNHIGGVACGLLHGQGLVQPCV